MCNGESVTLTQLASGDTNCPYGGVKLQVGSSTQYACSGQSLIWTNLTTSTTAQRNFGYVATGASGVTLTLPTTASTGDQVELLVQGTGAVTVTPGANQTIQYSGGLTLAPTFTRLRTGTIALASSADGRRIFAAGTSSYLSADGGATWTITSLPNQTWTDACMSADGTRIFVSSLGQPMYMSTDSGASFTANADAAAMYTVSCSASGDRLIAGGVNDGVYLSSDAGATWTEVSTAVLRDTTVWSASAVSADGSHLAVGDSNGSIYFSSDYGATWTTALGGATGSWNGVAMSSTGQRVYAVNSTTKALYVTGDFGASYQVASLPALSWGAITCSSDGMDVAATTQGGKLYVSHDGGTTWTLVSTVANNWYSSALSADGTRLLLLGSGELYSSGTPPSIVAQMSSALSLIFDANNAAWFVRSVNGTVYAP